MKQLPHLLMTVILVVSLGYASGASAIKTPQGLAVVGDEVAASNLGNLLVHVVSPITTTEILPSTYPLPGQKSLSLHVTACRGEFEPASFVLRAQSHDMTGVTLTATDLRSVNSSAVISSTHVDIKIVKPWFQSYSAWNEICKSDPADFRQRLVPELLLKDDALVSVDISAERNFVRLERGSPVYEWINQKKLAASAQVLPTMQEFPVKDAKTLQPFALPRSTSKQVWATIFVPRDTPPDEYSGDIEVRSNGTLQGTIKINLKVHRFELAESKITHSIYYRAVLDDARASVGSEYRNTEQMREELQNLLNHGVRNPTMYQPLSRTGTTKRGSATSTGSRYEQRALVLPRRTDDGFISWKRCTLRRETIENCLLADQWNSSGVWFHVCLHLRKRRGSGRRTGSAKKIMGHRACFGGQSICRRLYRQL